MQITEWAQQLVRQWRANSTKSLAPPSNNSDLLEPTDDEMLAAGWMPTEDVQESFDYADPFDDAIKREQGRIKAWSGVSVVDLQELDPMKLYDLDPVLLADERLRSTIPHEYQGRVSQAESADNDPSRYMKTWIETINIIAIDQAGIALVQSYVSCDYEGSEGWNFSCMPKAEAFNTIENYRSSHALLKQYGGPGEVLPSDFDYADPEGSFVRARHILDDEDLIEQRIVPKP